MAPSPRPEFETLAAELIAWAEEDAAVRAALAAEGALFEGYHPRMREVHVRNARRLEAVLDRTGWPTDETVGEAAAEAAWLIAQHAIGEPPFMRRCAGLLEAAVRAGAAPAWRWAMLADRISVLEGGLQTYGTQFDWDESGALSPLPCLDPGNLDARRAAVGLSPIAEKTAQMRASAAREGETPPKHWAARRAAAEAWAREAGWR